MKTQKTIIISLVIILATILLAACGSVDHAQAIPAVTPSQEMPIPEDLRDFRYCEILPVFRNGTAFTVEVYNTIGSNDCPADLWDQLDTDALAETYGAYTVERNGPRYWLINAVIGSGDTAEGKIASFDGLEMKKVATIELKVWDINIRDLAYTETEVERSNTWIFYVGNTVYELISPEGDVYRMQSYSQMVDPTQTIDDLETLGDRLDLPDGWKYQVRVLETDSELAADGVAYMIKDEFFNAYMKVLP